MEPPKEQPGKERQARVFRGDLSSAEIERLYPARVARIARGELSDADRGRLNEEVSRIDREWRGGQFNGIEYFHFRYAGQGARMAAFLWRERLHRLVPGSSQAPTPEEVDAAWLRLAREREAILAWARATRMLMEIVQAYRFERRQGACSSAAHAAAAKLVKKADPSIADPLGWAGVCIEWAEREHRPWFWRCTRDRQLL